MYRKRPGNILSNEMGILLTADTTESTTTRVDAKSSTQASAITQADTRTYILAGRQARGVATYKATNQPEPKN